MAQIEEEQWLEQVKNEWMVIPKFQVDPIKLKHLAIICDGNRRAANSKNLNPWVGHRMGVEVIHGILEAGRTWELPISHFGLGLPKIGKEMPTRQILLWS